jgi:Cu/Ag efflux pump CusA
LRAIQAARRRLRPLVMTALAAVAGMLPLALALGAGSQMLQPLAIAVIGGILISMLLSLIITPAIQVFLTWLPASRRVTESHPSIPLRRGRPSASSGCSGAADAHRE